MYKSIADGFKVIHATEGLKGFSYVSLLLYICTQRNHCIDQLLSPGNWLRNEIASRLD